MSLTPCHFTLEFCNVKPTLVEILHFFCYSLQQIVDLDEKNQILTSNVWLDMVWHDAAMVWNASFYNNVEVCRMVRFEDKMIRRNILRI